MRTVTTITLAIGLAAAFAAPASAQSTMGSANKPAATAAGETSPSHSGGGTRAGASHARMKSSRKSRAMMTR